MAWGFSIWSFRDCPENPVDLRKRCRTFVPSAGHAKHGQLKNAWSSWVPTRSDDCGAPARIGSLFPYSSAREAVAHAAIGDQREAESAINRALREVDRGLDDSEDPIWLRFVTAAEIQSITAQAGTFLGQHDKAVEFYQASVGAHNKPRDEASYRAYYSASLARLGDDSAAVTEGLSALALLEGPVKSHCLVSELQPARTAADRASTDDAEQFRSRFDLLLAH